MIFVLAPTFKETDLVDRFIENWLPHLTDNLQIIIVNANAGDASSEIIREYNNQADITEIPAPADFFWSGQIRLGLTHITKKFSPGDTIILTNIDVAPPREVIHSVLSSLDTLQALSLSTFTGTEFLHYGSKLGIIPRHFTFQSGAKRLILDYAPTRFLAFKPESKNDILLPNDEDFPHYAGDYELTLRMTHHGYRIEGCNTYTAFNDSTNTGVKRAEDINTLEDLTSNIRSALALNTRKKFYKFAYRNPERFVILALLYFQTAAYIAKYWLRRDR